MKVRALTVLVLLAGCAKPTAQQQAYAKEKERAEAAAKVEPKAEPPTAEQARQRALAKVQARHDEAVGQSNDPFWRHEHGNVKRWAASAYAVALEALRPPPESTETAAQYVKRVSAEVRSRREFGPDDDDEGWYSGAMDDAATLISGCAAAQ